MTDQNRFTKEEYLQAISDGVTEAICRDMPGSDQIAQAISGAISYWLTEYRVDVIIQKAIQDAAHNAIMPVEEAILQAIKEGHAA